MKDWQIKYDKLYNDPLFDHEWYVKRYNDVRDTGLSPLEHYVKYGYRLGRYTNDAMISPQIVSDDSNQTCNDVLVSVICITYNHEKFISQTMDSIIQQKTNFKFEILVGVDKSTDRTGNIVREYAKKYQNIVYFERNNNIGANKNFIDLAKAVKGKFVAICEGDDYWIDADKLQLQVDFLKKNPEYTICFHPVQVLYEKDTSIFEVFPKEKPPIMDLKTLLTYNFIQTNSVMYKWKFSSTNPLDFDNIIAPADWYIHLLHAEVGRIGFIDRIMGVYRKHQGGMWASHSDAISRFKKLARNEIALFRILDKKYNSISGSRFVEAQYYIFSSLIKHYLLSNDFMSIFNVIKDNNDCATSFMKKLGFEIKSEYNSYKDLELDLKLQTKTSVIVTAYNHGKYIGKCLDSILMQKTFFDVEIVIGDDCSSDNTSEIIASYVKKYPNKIKQVKRSKNVGMLRNMDDCIAICSGKYIAFCEADDYWISDRYLYRKIEIMIADNSIGMCFNWLLLCMEDNSTYLPHTEQGDLPQGFVNFSSLINAPLTANFSCCLYRKDALLSIPRNFYNRSLAADWLLNLYVAENYKVYFMKEILSVYTVHPKGQWSGLNNEERARLIEDYKKEYKSIFNYKTLERDNYINLIVKNNITEFDILGWIDTPKDQIYVTDDSYINISGWVMAQDYSNLRLSVVNDTEIVNVERNIIRKDVVNSIYGCDLGEDVSTCGFATTVKVSDFTKLSVFININNRSIHWFDLEKINN